MMRIKKQPPAEFESEEHVREFLDDRHNIIADARVRLVKQLNQDADEVILAALAAGVPISEIQIIYPAPMAQRIDVTGFTIFIGPYSVPNFIKLW
ncbi:hypothetical protein [Vibrio harveyi]|uniref:hypothetical protein n=1 Tax=Vibrio harveyi TaxID=669 RepID=UPI0025AFC590|nr:hypothetical protein [Vibrio harveyi]WJT09233.1 hypothetical protein PH545_24720 [Vibrio harveyi]